MPSIDVDGVSLYYERAGSGEPVLFSHGIPTDYRAWNAQVEAFSKSYSTITYSRRYAAPNHREGDVSDSTVAANAANTFEALGSCSGPSPALSASMPK